MQRYSKAIAAAVSAVVGLLVAFNLVTPALAETLNEATVTMIVTTITTVAGVWMAPANKAE